MDVWSYWFIISFVLLGLELATGTLYLLLLAGGCVAGALVAWAGLPLLPQFGATAVVSLFLLLILRKKFIHKRWKHPVQQPHTNPDINPDIGQTLYIEGWQNPGPTRARYRGSVWTVAPAPGCPQTPGAHQIVAVEANTLVVAPLGPGPTDHTNTH